VFKFYKTKRKGNKSKTGGKTGLPGKPKIGGSIGGKGEKPKQTKRNNLGNPKNMIRTSGGNPPHETKAPGRLKKRAAG